MSDHIADRSSSECVQRLIAERLDRQAAELLGNWEELYQLTLRVGDMTLDLLPGSSGEGTMLEEIITDAVEAWNTASHAGAMEAYAGFLMSVIKNLPRVLDYAVYIQANHSRTIVWDPMGAGLIEWASRYPGRPVHIERRANRNERCLLLPEAELQKILAGKVMNSANMVVLQRVLTWSAKWPSDLRTAN